MNNLNSEFHVHYRVYVEDTDVMGIVYHANHLRFYERARTELLRHHGLVLTEMAREDTHFAIYDVRVRYFSPAKLDDLLLIKTSFEKIKKSTLEFRQFMYNQSKQLLSEARVYVVCVNSKLKPKRLPEKIMAQSLLEE